MPDPIGKKQTPVYREQANYKIAEKTQDTENTSNMKILEPIDLKNTLVYDVVSKRWRGTFESLDQIKLNGHLIRCCRDQGSPWYVAKDVAQALGFNSHAEAAHGVDKTHKRVVWLADRQWSQETRTIVISEIGYLQILCNRLTHTTATHRSAAAKLPGGSALSRESRLEAILGSLSAHVANQSAYLSSRLKLLPAAAQPEPAVSTETRTKLKDKTYDY